MPGFALSGLAVGRCSTAPAPIRVFLGRGAVTTPKRWGGGPRVLEHSSCFWMILGGGGPPLPPKLKLNKFSQHHCGIIHFPVDFFQFGCIVNDGVGVLSNWEGGWGGGAQRAGGAVIALWAALGVVVVPPP